MPSTKTTGDAADTGQRSRVTRFMLAIPAAVLLAAFFLLVGFNKAFAAPETLAEHGAWTVHLPPALGRAVGWSEMACAAAIVAGLLRRAWRLGLAVAASVLVVNQAIAAGVHVAHGESSALTQNAVLVALLLLIAWAGRRR